MYADDVLLLPSVFDLQKMINLGFDKASCLNLKFNANKSCVLRFEAQYLIICTIVSKLRWIVW